MTNAQLRAFHAVAAERSFTKAAAVQRVSQPTLSAQVRREKGLEDVPSVLIELGYLSSSADESVMNTSRWRKRMADSIARAVDGSASGTTPFRVFFKDGIVRGSVSGGTPFRIVWAAGNERQGQDIRQHECAQIHCRQHEQCPAQRNRRPQHDAFAHHKHRPGNDRKCPDFHHGVERTDTGTAAATTPALCDPTQHRDEFEGAEDAAAAHAARPCSDHVAVRRQAHGKHAQKAADKRGGD